MEPWHTIRIALVLLSSVFYHMGFRQPKPDNRKLLDGEKLFERLGPSILMFKKLSEPPLSLVNILFLLAIQNVDLSSNVSPDVSPVCYLGSRAYSPISDALLVQMLLIGTCLAAIGGFIRFWCIGLLDGMFTYALTVTDSHRLITYGPYAYVRHPAYTGIWLLAAGEILIHISTGVDVFVRPGCGALKTFALVNFAAWLLVMVYTCIGLYKRAFSEDTLMEKRFGKEWYAWRERTPYLFLPGIA